MAVFPHGVSITQEPDGILRVTVPADLRFAAMLSGVEFLRDHTRSRQKLRLLLDLRAIDPPPGLVEQAIVGEHIAREMQHADRLASIVAPGTRTGTSERVARSFNLDLRVFESEADGLAWLRS